MPLPEVPEILRALPDGTVKQRNPFTGTEVWTVPGRGNRPLGPARPQPRPVDPADAGRLCAFCADRQAETTPEKARLVRRTGDDGSPSWGVLRHVPAERQEETVAEFRRVPNLFEILGFDYWRLNHGHTMPAEAARWRDAYLATPEGRSHVVGVVRTRLKAAGRAPAEVAAVAEHELLAGADGLFASGHDVIIARRHLVDGARDASQLVSSGTLTPEEHRAFIAFTADAARDLYAANPHVRYVSVFQNWLKPAGASFDHLHKQLVAIDEVGAQNEAVLARVREDPDVFAHAVLEPAEAHGLVIARTRTAVMLAGVGHRYPTVEVWSTAEACEPWEHTDAERDAVSDLLHAAHAATGPDVPVNEEWHTRPAGATERIPWRIMLKWRISTLAGFEGATKINVNTISPWGVRDRLLPRLRDLQAAGALGEGILLEGEPEGRAGT